MTLNASQAKLIYHTDGSCEPNPGDGGYAVVRNMKACIMGWEQYSTNNRMEGKAIIEALKDAGTIPCVIYTDSMLWVNIVTKWAARWEINGWEKKTSGEIKNLDIVKQVHSLYRESRAVLMWVKGHDDDDGNILADQLANSAREMKQTLVLLPRPKLVRRKVVHT